jgi:tRNA uridine 5-carbamoylmethylation protein Kti12
LARLAKEARENLEPEKEKQYLAQLEKIAEQVRNPNGTKQQLKARLEGPAEDTRKAVWKSIRRAYRDMDKKLPELVKHLKESIKQAEHPNLVYIPSNSSPPDWKL